MIPPLVTWAIFPGINLHARLRYRILPRYFGTPVEGKERRVLDAGCGNGMLSYRAWQKSNRVLGVSIKASEVAKCRALFNSYMGIPEDRLEFRELNLYEVESLHVSFDEIVCSEVIEHILDDRLIAQIFSRVLKPDGVLHLCSPNAEHPDNRSHLLDSGEYGGHVRTGYTLDTYRDLLESAGFEIQACVGLGGPIREVFNRVTIRVQTVMGAWAGVPVFLVGWLLSWLDRSVPKVPYSIYVKAVKRNANG